jgi:serine/threonine protein phosphatase PrpC
MKIEHFTLKGEGRLNEDAIVMNEAASIYGVLDGVTSLTPYVHSSGATGGYIAANMVKECLEKLGNSQTLLAEIDKANRLLREEMRKENIEVSKKENLWGAALAVAAIDEHHVRYAQTGDCMIMAVYACGTVRVLTHSQVAHLDCVTVSKCQEGIERGLRTRSELRAYVMDVLVGNRQKSNTVGGYGVLNGEEGASAFVEAGTIQRSNLRHLIMITDGLFKPEGKLSGGAYWEDIARDILDRGLEAYARSLQEWEDRDPDCTNYPRLKKSDDKTGVVIHF